MRPLPLAVNRSTTVPCARRARLKPGGGWDSSGVLGTPPPLLPPAVPHDMELRIEHLTKTYPNGVRALHDVTLTIPRCSAGR